MVVNNDNKTAKDDFYNIKAKIDVKYILETNNYSN